MLEKTQGIVLRTTKYSETSIICSVFTKNLGLRSYIINGVRSAKAKVNPGLVQVMSLVDLVVYHHENRDLNRIKEIKPLYVYQRIPFEVIRGTIGLFMVEIAQKTIKETEENSALFEFLKTSFIELDRVVEGLLNLHLIYLANLCKFLGFEPNGSYSKTSQLFDMREGKFTNAAPGHRYFMEDEFAAIFSILLKIGVEHANEIDLSTLQRRQVLDYIILYFRIHVESLNTVNSHQILKEVLS